MASRHGYCSKSDESPRCGTSGNSREENTILKAVKVLSLKQKPQRGGTPQDKSSVEPLLHQQQQTHCGETQHYVGPTFNELHLMYDKHYEAQVELVDAIAERIQVLGASRSRWRRTSRKPPTYRDRRKGREPASVQLSRLIDAHTLIIKAVPREREEGRRCRDSGTDDLLVSQVLRTNELQVWFLSEHLVAASPV